MAMRKIFPAAKFIPPRSRTHKRPASGGDEPTPLVVDEPAADITAGRKRTKPKLVHTARQQWHQPRSFKSTTTTTTAKSCRDFQPLPTYSASTTGMALCQSSLCRHLSGPEHCCERTFFGRAEEGARSAPDTPTAMKTPLVLAAETPDGKRVSSTLENGRRFDNRTVEVGRLRIPDSPDNPEPRSDVPQLSRAKIKRFEGNRERLSSGLKRTSSSSDLQNPRSQEPSPRVQEVGVGSRTCSVHERLSASTSRGEVTDPRFESPDLLRAYTTGNSTYSSFGETSDATAMNGQETSSATRRANIPARSVFSQPFDSNGELALDTGTKPSVVPRHRVALHGLDVPRAAGRSGTRAGADMGSLDTNSEEYATDSTKSDASTFQSLQKLGAVTQGPPAAFAMTDATLDTSTVRTPSKAPDHPSREAVPTPAPSSGAGSTPNSSSITPPERQFERRHQLLYKSATGARRGRGRGRGRGLLIAGAGKLGKRRSSAPMPAQGRLVGDWRMERGKKGDQSKRFYITRTGQKLTGREAYKAAQEDKQARAAGGGQSIVDRSTIMKKRRPDSVESPQNTLGSEKHVHDEVLQLSTYGVPDELVASYALRGVQRLFPWQADCLRVDDGKPLSGRNLVYSAPTSGGKTLVAEVLLLRALLQHDGTMALLVVPFIALAMEKRDYLREVWAPLQLNIQAYHGSEGGDDDGGMDGVNVAMCTMEKANSIVNRLAEERRLEVLSAVVVDEMHLIADGQRGFLLELMLSKLRMVCPTKVQLVCLSATLPNIDSVAKWLDASLYRTEFRPVELRHKVCKARQVFAPTRGVGSGSREGECAKEGPGELVRVVGGDIKKIGQTSPAADPDGVVDLVKDALQRDMSVLIFCATKRWCNTTAALLAKEISSEKARAAKVVAAAVAAENARSNLLRNGLPTCRQGELRCSNVRVQTARQLDRKGRERVRPNATPEAPEAPQPSLSSSLSISSSSSMSSSSSSSTRSRSRSRQEADDGGETRGICSSPGSVSAKLVSVVKEEGARGVASHPGTASCGGTFDDLRGIKSGNDGNGGGHARESKMSKTPAFGERVKPSEKQSGGRLSTASQVAGMAVAAARVRERLRETPVGLDAELAHLVGAGVAFHHSGLVVEERSILEDEFRQGTIRVLVATSTLAAGVNLPAHRVIIRSPHIGMGMIDSTRIGFPSRYEKPPFVSEFSFSSAPNRYHQMAGRSGRAGVSRGDEGVGGDSKESKERVNNTCCGESYLIIPKGDKMTIPDASKLITAPLPRLKSALRGAKGGGLERALLEVVVSNTVSTRAGAIRFVSNTFLAQQVDVDDLTRACDSALEFLLKHNFVIVVGTASSGEKQGDDYGLSSTQLGQATFFSGLSPLAAVDVHRSLDKACDNLVVATELHALYLLTPLEGLEPDWGRFREEYTGWSERDSARVVGKAVGIEEGVLVKAAGHTSHTRPKYGERHFVSSRGSGASRREVDLQPYRRFYAALVLQQAVEEVPIRNMAKRLGIERGTLQALQKEASVFCGMVVCFCRHLQWHELANVLYSFQERLSYSAKPELLPLVRLSRDLPPFRARALLKAGYPSPLELAGADCARVAEVFMRCLPFRSAGWDESEERYQTKQTERLAQNVIRLADKEVLRQLRERLSGASVDVAGVWGSRTVGLEGVADKKR